MVRAIGLKRSPFDFSRLNFIRPAGESAKAGMRGNRRQHRQAADNLPLENAAFALRPMRHGVVSINCRALRISFAMDLRRSMAAAV
jgi:hypothetical protein